MVVDIEKLIGETKEKERERAKYIEERIDKVLEKISGKSFLEKEYFEFKVLSNGLNDRIVELIVNRYKEKNLDMEINYELINEKNTDFYKFIFKQIK